MHGTPWFISLIFLFVIGLNQIFADKKESTGEAAQKFISPNSIVQQEKIDSGDNPDQTSAYQGGFPQPYKNRHQQRISPVDYAPGFDPVSLTHDAQESIQNLYEQNNKPQPNPLYRTMPSEHLGLPVGSTQFNAVPGFGGNPMMDHQPGIISEDEDEEVTSEVDEKPSLVSKGSGLLTGLKELLDRVMGGSLDDAGSNSQSPGITVGTGMGNLVGGLFPTTVNDDGSESEDGATSGILPVGTKLTFNNDLSIPMPAPIGQIRFTIPLTYNFNGSFGSSTFRRSRQMPSDQSSILKMIEQAMTNMGIDGKTCVLRAICEVNEKPLEGINIIGEIATAILSPSTEDGSTDFLEEYVAARKIGRSKGACWKKYKKCPLSITAFIRGLELEQNEEERSNRNWWGWWN